MDEPRSEARHAGRVLCREWVAEVAHRLSPSAAPPSAWAGGCSVLLYHRIVAAEPPWSAPFDVSEARFRAQVEWLSAHRTVISAAQLADRIREGQSVAGSAVITFDDGYDCTVRRALPILQQAALPATVLFETGSLDRSRRDLVQALANGGLEIGSHTVSHPDLTTLPTDRLRDELVRSRNLLQDAIGRSCNGFAYPYGAHNDRVVAEVQAAGYAYACTCLQHENNTAGTSPYRLRRVEVNARDDADRWHRKLHGANAVVYGAWYKIARPHVLEAVR